MTPSHLSVRQAVDRMNSELRQRYQELQTLLAEATGKDVRARYRVGALIAEVKRGENRYGARAVKNLASALGRDEATLYRFALVAEAWTERELEALLARKTPHGEPLSFSHLVELAQVSDKGRRAELLEFALSYGVSVRELLDAIADTGTDLSERDEGSPSLDSVLRKVTTACDAVQRKIEISERLFSQLDRADPKSRLSLDELLARAVSSQRAILEASARSIERLERARRQLSVPPSPEARLAAPPSPARLAVSAVPAVSSEVRHSSGASPEATFARLPSSEVPKSNVAAARAVRRAAGDVRMPRLLAGFAR